MKLALAAALAWSALGCAPQGVAAPPAHPTPDQPAPDNLPHPPPPAPRLPLDVKALDGPFPTLKVACDTAVGLAGAPYPGAPCAVTPIDPGADAPFSAALLRAEDKHDPRYAASGVFFLALGADGTWFVRPAPLDQINGAAGHTYLPVVTVAAASTTAKRTLFHLRDVTSSVCNPCEGPDREKQTPVETRALVVVCGRDRRGTPACTTPLTVDEKAKVTMAPDGSLTIAAPGAAPKVYIPLF